jgi:glycosyltransferase involved in cell wall biosynthesis
MTPIHIESLRASLVDNIFNLRWPDAGVRMQNLPPKAFTKVAGGYDLLWANSIYTQRWIYAYWGLPSEVLYPPVDVEQYAPGGKRPRILSVGRFFAGNHNKKHLVMVDAFRSLLEDGLTGWELHLAGGVTPGRQHLEYLQKVRQATQGMPIHIHTDLPQQRLLDLYATSSIYWHAAGFDESPTKQPQKFEHFGISIVEAMAAGCAPIVMGQGGATELIRHDRDGFLWYTSDELRTQTRRLARDAGLRSRIAQAAIVSSRRFSEASFDSCLRESLTPLIE